ncbi:MAG: tRNA lysidine(34) synthetase TilS [Bacteroidales bacterium]|nr:tRNA lysidine(34) synthetase TilS [Bacteroidales bacterium]
MTIRQKVANYIKEKQLMPEQGKIIVALSGGADSVALLYLLSELNYPLIAAHCNFHLRGAESDRDEAFVRALTCRMGIECHVISFDTKEYAATRGYSIEMAARELRYDWFEQLRRETGAAMVAVAHHSDDSVETVLLNLMRGTGIQGLTGIAPLRDAVVRPLLCLSRSEILTYLQEKGVDYVTDSTNLEDEYTRNKIRLDLLPVMRQTNPSVSEAILRTADNLRELADWSSQWLQKAKESVLKEGRMDIEELLSSPMPRMLLYDILQEKGFNRSQCEQVFDALQGISGKVFFSKSHRLIKDREYLYIEPLTDASFDAIEIAKGCESVPHPLESNLFLTLQEKEITSQWQLPKASNHVAIDAEKVKYPLVWRCWQSGDWFHPFGMKGKKKLSDYMTDKKYTLSQKERMTVLCSGQDIVWLVGERPDNRYRITEQSKKALEIRIHSI